MVVNTVDSTSYNGCEQLIREASQIGIVGGIWNLAVCLEDGIFCNQSGEKFINCLKPKAHATINLDEVSQKLCSELQIFVAFSSISSGIGNPGQTNYGMANSIIERLIEKRRRLGLPGKVIQWGPIDDVGLLTTGSKTNALLKASGIEYQPISSCLNVLDTLMNADDPIVSSMIIADKKMSEHGKKSPRETIFNILGITDPKSVAPDSLLGDLGMDSLVSVEVSQVLARDHDIHIPADAMKYMKLNALEDVINKKVDLVIAEDMTKDLPINRIATKDEDALIVRLETAYNGDTKVKILILPGIDGIVIKPWKNTMLKSRHQTYLVQHGIIANCSNFEEIFAAVAPVSKYFLGLRLFFKINSSSECEKILSRREKLFPCWTFLRSSFEFGTRRDARDGWKAWKSSNG